MANAKTPIDPAQALRDQRAQRGRDEATHELPLLEEVASVMADMAPLLDRLEAVRAQLLDINVPVHINGLASIAGNLTRSVEAPMAQARRTLEA